MRSDPAYTYAKTKARGCESEGVEVKRLTTERKQKRWSKAELGRRANMNPATVGQIENGILRPYASQLHKLAVALGWNGDPQALMDETD